MPDDEEEQTTSEEYESQALDEMEKGHTENATVLAQLALCAVIRESTHVVASVIADAFDDDDDDEDEDEDEGDEDDE